MNPIPTILVFLKAPRPGYVKTRLGREIGGASAVDIYRGLVERQLKQIPNGWNAEIHYAPREALDEMRGWLGTDWRFVPQHDGDLGRRLQHAFDRSFSGGADRVIAIGGDCPGLTADDLGHARDALDRDDAVLGPARDGGYYLIGLRRPIPGVFAGIAWSTPDVFQTTIRRIQEAEASWSLLPEKDDIDDLAGLARWLQSEPAFVDPFESNASL